jgi:predicted small secreted protein
MEGKAMKKKIIILFLSLILIAMFLTGCSTNVTGEEIKNLEDVASELKKADNGYQLPEGYEIKFSDSTSTERITLIVVPSSGDGDKIEATFDVTGETPVLIEIEQPISGMSALMVSTVILGILLVILLVVLAMV